jgi:hypothetical protein
VKNRLFVVIGLVSCVFLGVSWWYSAKNVGGASPAGPEPTSSDYLPIIQKQPTPTFTPTPTASPTATPTLSPTSPPAAGSWQEVGDGSATEGGISDNDGWSMHPGAAVAPDGTVYIAWDDYSSGEAAEIYVRRWNGSGWEEVGAGSASGSGISNDVWESTEPTIAISSQGVPYVAWQNYDGAGSTEIFVRRWNGNNWEEVGVGSAGGGGISHDEDGSYSPSIAIAPDGMPYVAWGYSVNGNWDDSEIYVRRWNGNVWEEVGAGSATGGGISNNEGDSRSVSLAIAPNGTPYVTWSDDSVASLNYEIYVRRWNGVSWEEAGTGSANGGGISQNSGYSWTPSIAVASDNTVYITWRDGDTFDNDIYVRRWNGSSWEEVGLGSAADGGISQHGGSSGYPDITVAPNGMPYVSWHGTNGSLDGEIYVRRWNGNGWQEVGIGSAMGGGISNNNGDSLVPSVVAVGDGTIYATWFDNEDGDFEIYVRRWIEE